MRAIRCPKPVLLLLLTGIFTLLSGSVTCIARVLDDFNDNVKTGWQDFSFNIGFPYSDISEQNGQFNFALAPVGQPIFSASTKTSETFNLQEGRTIEFRVDLVAGNGRDSFAVLAFVPTGTDISQLAGYGLSKSPTDILIIKGINKYFYEGTPALKNTNVTMVLSMTVKDGSVIINGKVLDKDNNNAVLFDQTVVDTPGADGLAAGVDSPAAPYLGSGNFVLICYEDNGTTQASYEVTFDNAEVYVTDHSVLDDFNDNSKTAWQDFSFNIGFPYSDISEQNGQFDFNLAPIGQSIFSASTKTSRAFDLVEGERVEFRVDLVAGNGRDSFAVLAFVPTGSDISQLAGYGISKSPTDILIIKGINKYFFAGTPALKNTNVTMVLSMTVKDGSVIINGKVLDKDNNNAVLFDQTVVDTPGADGLAAGVDSPAAPYLGSGNFVLICYEDNGTTQASYEVTFDNAEVFAPPVAANTAPLISQVAPTAFANFLPATTAVSFTVTDDKALSTNRLAVTLNGTRYTTANGLSVSGSGNTLNAALSGALATNVAYEAVLEATDSEEVTVKNVFYFDTFLADDPIIEVEDYNFGSGQFIDNPAPYYEGFDQTNSYSLRIGTSGVDYSDTRTNLQDAPYRPGDHIRMQHSLDQVRQKYSDLGGANFGIWDYDVGDIAAGEFMNYTRTFATGTYEVYLRQAYANVAKGQAVFDRVTGDRSQANPSARVLGSFLGAQSGFQYRNIPLTDGFGEGRVHVRLSGVETLRLRQVTAEPPDGNIFQNYLLLVPVADPGLQRAFAAAVWPVPGGVVDTVTPNISVTIQNRDTTVQANSIALFFNGAPVTPAIAADTNGAAINYTLWPPPPVGATNSARLVFADNTGVFQTNDWSFAYTYKLVDPANRKTGSGVNPGFAVRVVQAPRGSNLASSLARAEAQLAPNSTIPKYYETNVVDPIINYSQRGPNSADGYFPNDALIPGLDIGANGDDDIAMEILTYLDLPAGSLRFGVRSDDGYKIASGTSLTDTNALPLGSHDGGPADETFDFVVAQAGLYPFRMVWYERGGGANVEWFSVDKVSGTRTLINDTNAPGAIKAFTSVSGPAAGVTIESPHLVAGNLVLSFQSETGRTYTLQASSDLSSWGSSGVDPLNGTGGTLSFTIPAPAAPHTFYRVQTQ